MTQEVLKLALEALEAFNSEFVCQATHHKRKNQHSYFSPCPNVAKYDEAIIAIKEALREHAMYEVQRLGQEIEQEAVALETVYETIIQWDEGGGKRSRRDLARRIIDLYTHPPQRTWQGLTIDEREQIQQECFGKVPHHVAFAHAVEAKLKEKNT